MTLQRQHAGVQKHDEVVEDLLQQGAAAGQIVLFCAGLLVYLGRLWAVRILKLNEVPGA